jgi:hypothetical protein
MGDKKDRNNRIKNIAFAPATIGKAEKSTALSARATALIE